MIKRFCPKCESNLVSWLRSKKSSVDFQEVLEEEFECRACQCRFFRVYEFTKTVLVKESFEEIQKTKES